MGEAVTRFIQLFTVKQYHPDLLTVWESVLQQSINGTFMHSRSYMDYHEDRFSDLSLIIYRKFRPVAIFPAHRLETALYSHLGLSYGGPVIVRLSVGSIFQLFECLFDYCRNFGIKTIHFKQIPSIYTGYGTEWMEYVLFRRGATRTRVDLTLTIPISGNEKIYRRERRWKTNKAARSGITIKETHDLKGFWEEVLTPNLWEHHQVKPVHTLEEIRWLAENNRPHIRQFNACYQGRIIAGATIYETATVAHVQYMAATPTGKEMEALGFLIHQLIFEVFTDKRYFDLGTVNEENGKRINKGLLKWKESFGAKPFIHQYYSISL